MIPKTFKAVYLAEFGKPLIVKELPMPQLQPGQVLIKVEAAPINPADILFNVGFYPSGKTTPTIPGLEGSGTVVASKCDLAQKYLGKKVGFYTNHSSTGSYGNYAITEFTNIVPLPEGLSFEHGSTSFINPFTVVLMLNQAKKNGSKAVIHTAAASQLGRFMVRYFQTHGVEVIGVVRKKEQEEIFKSVGGKYVVNSSDPNYLEQLTKYAEQLGATTAFDAIAGDTTGNILSAMPNHSTIYVYGGLSGQGSGNISLADTIFKGKTVKGFWINSQLENLTEKDKMKLPEEVSSLLSSNFKSEISKIFPYEQYNEAVQYYQDNMSKGKVIIKHTV